VSHPIRLVVDDDLRRSRLTVFFRLLLAVPQLVWLYVWTFVFLVLAMFNWFTTLCSGRTEGDVHSFAARYVRFSVHLYAYVLLVANPWPPFSGRPGTYPVDLEVDPPEPQRRLVTLFRLVLVLPAYVFSSVLLLIAEVIAVIAWFIALFAGRVPKGMRDLSAYCLRYNAQMWSYLFLLTSRYPSLASGSGFQFEEG
jgi:hypothetical protein